MVKKLILLLTFLSSLTLIVFSGRVIQKTVHDQKVRVLSVNLNEIEDLSKRVEAEIRRQREKISMMLDLVTKSDEAKRTLFRRHGISAISVFQINSGNMQNVFKWSAPGGLSFSNLSPEIFQKAIQKTIQEGFHLQFSPESNNWVFAYRSQLQETKVAVVALFPKHSWLQEFWTSRSGYNVFFPEGSYDHVASRADQLFEKQELLDLKAHTSGNPNSFIQADPESTGPGWVVATTTIPGVGWFASISSAEVFERSLIANGIQTGLFLISLLSFIPLISVASVKGVTWRLRQLIGLTQRISNGDFDINYQDKSRDEVAQLGNSFNIMSKEILNLLEETKEKSRMEQELKVAHMVQTRIVPQSDCQRDWVEIVGHYQSASECGGDFWTYSDLGDKFFICIADATGHGVAPALVTSAARSATSLVETYKGLDLANLARIFNRCVFSTSQGDIQMTAFFGIIEKETLNLKFVNASHEQPLVLNLKSKEKGQFKKSDIGMVVSETAPRMGEVEDQQFEVHERKLSRGDQLIFYTDGITECRNPEGEMFRERRLIKSAYTAANEARSAAEVRQKILSDLNDFRRDQILEDDVTLAILRLT